ncbi:hypothetical protein FJ976_29485 [Mesorhizobium sp. B1-1-9]|nr:hypothetical protein FJ976_29485 [Mesorhizobium sp. B1-1-9]TPN43487.1 hypothetical protein FJ978_30790 [Mesorhizobium sp. B1-1-7]
MRGVPGNANVSLRWNTPHPSRRCAPIHLLPQGEKAEARVPTLPGPCRPRSAPSCTSSSPGSRSRLAIRG